MEAQESKETHECQCVGNKKVKKLEQDIKELKEKISTLEKTIQLLRRAMR